MTKPFEDEQEKSASTTEIKHAFWRRSMELQILHAFSIQSQPGLDVCILGVSHRQAGIALLNLAQTFLIDLCPHRPQWQAKN